MKRDGAGRANWEAPADEIVPVSWALPSQLVQHHPNPILGSTKPPSLPENPFSSSIPFVWSSKNTPFPSPFGWLASREETPTPLVLVSHETGSSLAKLPRLASWARGRNFRKHTDGDLASKNIASEALWGRKLSVVLCIWVLKQSKWFSPFIFFFLGLRFIVFWA